MILWRDGYNNEQVRRFGGEVLTNINCSSRCIYQKDGKCNLEKVSAATLQTSNENCIYFQKAEPAGIEQKE